MITSNEEYIKICNKAGLEAKANGKYAKPDEWKASRPHMREMDEITGRIKSAKNILARAGEVAEY